MRSNVAGRDPRNPGKPVIKVIPAVCNLRVFEENPREFMRTIDALSMALVVYKKNLRQGSFAEKSRSKKK